MRKFIVSLIGLASLGSGSAIAYSAYSEPYQISIISSTHGQAAWGFSIGGAPGDGSSPGTVQCGTPNCWVGFLVRTGLGPAPGRPSLLDSGGVTIINTGNQLAVTAVSVRNGVSWDTAYETFAKTYGYSGTAKVNSPTLHPNDAAYPYVKWGALCAGFASIADNVRSITTLAPGSGCGVFTPPDVQCNFTLPGLLDFGVVPLGGIPGPVSESGSYSCNMNSTVSASIGTIPSIGGSRLSLYLNNVQLSQTSKDIAHGERGTLTLRGEIVNPMLKDGVFTESVPVIISFY